MTGQRWPVFCVTEPERCGPDLLFLGYGRMGEIMKCPRCGRNSAAGIYKWKLSEWKDKKNIKGIIEK